MPQLGPELDAPANVVRLLDPGLEADPDAVALVSAERRFSWRELDDAVDRLASNLLATGLEPGDRVASLMPNRTLLSIHYLACWRAGLIAVPLNYRYRPPEIDHALEVSEASLLISHAERSDDLAQSARVADLRLGIVPYGAPDGHGTTFESLLESEAGPAPVPESHPGETPAVIFFTSGSTGLPKGVTHTHGTLGWMFASTARALELGPTDTLLAGSSMSHLGAFMFCFATLGVGATAVIARTYDGDELLPLLREERPTVMTMLPAALFALVRDHDASRADFASLRLCRAGGDKVAPELEKEFTELTGYPIDEGYGMSEVGLAAVGPPSGEIRIGSLGLPVPGFTLSVRDESGAELGPGEEGRLWMKTPTSTVGYWGRPEATEQLYDGDWLDSGDVMRYDEDGYFWFCGRKKQIIVHDGSNINPQEIEGVLMEHPSVDMAGVVGVHDLLHGENVRAYISIREGSDVPTSQELIRFARQRVGYKAPEEIVVLDEIPYTGTGKVDRTTLKRLAEQTQTG